MDALLDGLVADLRTSGEVGDRRPRRGRPAVCGRNRADAHRPRRGATGRRRLPAGRRRRRRRRASRCPRRLQSLLAARLDALDPSGTSAGRRCRGSRQQLPRRGTGRGVRPARGAGPSAARRAGAPGGARGAGRSAVAATRPLRLRADDVPSGRLRHAVATRAQAPVTWPSPPICSRRSPTRAKRSPRSSRPHLIDALDAIPDDPDVGDLRQRAVGMLTRAGDRAVRTGAPTTAAKAYTTAAELLEHTGDLRQLAAAALHERAGAATSSTGEFPAAVEHYQHGGRDLPPTRPRTGRRPRRHRPRRLVAAAGPSRGSPPAHHRCTGHAAGRP